MVALPLRAVLNTVAYTMTDRARLAGAIPRARRPAASAGGLHAIEVLILPTGRRPRVFRYDAEDHCLQRIAIGTQVPLRDVVRVAREILPEGAGTLLVLVGDVAKARAAYDEPQSLLWRDAGALLQTLNLSATAFGQAFCALGILGGEVLEALDMQSTLAPLGVALLGKPVGQAAT